MKKNRTMRVAVLMLALTLITSCFVGGTLAKYTTNGTASDTARVAKWGVEITATENGSVFANAYEASEGSDATGIVVQANEKVVAPGTSSEEVNSTLVFDITGTPEVATKVSIDFEGTDIYVGDYHPIVFTLSVKDVSAGHTDWVVLKEGTLAEIDTYLNETYSTNGGLTFAAGTVLDAEYKIDWAWDFDDNGAGTNDVNDTLLGNLAAGTATTELDYSTVLKYGVTVTVEQVD